MTTRTMTSAYARTMGDYSVTYKPFSKRYDTLPIKPVSAEQILALEHASRDAQPQTAGCLFCEWTAAGTVGEMRKAAARHRARKHPAAKKARTRPAEGNGLHHLDPSVAAAARRRGGKASSEART